MELKKEDPCSRAYALVFLHRLGLVNYTRGRKGLIEVGIPESLVDSALYAPTVRHLRMIVKGHVNPLMPVGLDCRPLRMPRIAA